MAGFMSGFNFRNLFSGEMITVTIVQDIDVIPIDGGSVTQTQRSGNKFTIHKDTLQASSPFFRAMNNFVEGQKKEVIIHNTTPLAFAIYAEWLYTNNLPDDAEFRELDALIQAYLLGDLLCSSTFQNFILFEIQRMSYTDEVTPYTLLIIQEAGLTENHTISKCFLNSIAFRAVEELEDLENAMKQITGGKNSELFLKGGPLVLALVEKIILTVHEFKTCRW